MASNGESAEKQEKNENQIRDICRTIFIVFGVRVLRSTA